MIEFIKNTQGKTWDKFCKIHGDISKEYFCKKVEAKIKENGLLATLRGKIKFDWLDLEVAKRLTIKGVLHLESYSYQGLEVLFWVDSYLISYLIDCSERIHDCEEEIDSVIKEINSYCNWFEPRNLWIDDEKIEYTAREFWNHEIIY